MDYDFENLQKENILQLFLQTMYISHLLSVNKLKPIQSKFKPDECLIPKLF